MASSRIDWTRKRTGYNARHLGLKDLVNRYVCGQEECVAAPSQSAETSTTFNAYVWARVV